MAEPQVEPQVELQVEPQVAAPDPAPSSRDYRGQVLAALQGAARRGWLGPVSATRCEPGIGTTAERVFQLDLLALAIKTTLERIALPLATTARAFSDKRAWTTFGYARVEDYARERLSRTGRWLRDHASLGRALDRLPTLSPALTGADGGRPLGKVSALWVGKVASTESVEAWIALARSVSVRELKETVT